MTREQLPDVRCVLCSKPFHPADLGPDGSCRECNPPRRPQGANRAARHSVRATEPAELPPSDE